MVSTPFVIQKFIIGLVGHPNVICEMIANPLFKPTLGPAGVSMGQTQPY